MGFFCLVQPAAAAARRSRRFILAPAVAAAVKGGLARSCGSRAARRGSRGGSEGAAWLGAPEPRRPQALLAKGQSAGKEGSKIPGVASLRARDGNADRNFLVLIC